MLVPIYFLAVLETSFALVFSLLVIAILSTSAFTGATLGIRGVRVDVAGGLVFKNLTAGLFRDSFLFVGLGWLVWWFEVFLLCET